MRWMVSGLLLASLTHAAFAGTELDKFTSALEKVSPVGGTMQHSGQFKSLCVCLSNQQIGVVERFQGINGSNRFFIAACESPQFDTTTGAVSGESACPGTAWMPLTRP